MNGDLSKLIYEYTNISCKRMQAYYVSHPVGHVHKPYRTGESSFIFPLKGRGFFGLDKESFAFIPGMVIHASPNKLLNARNIGDVPVEFYIMYYDGEPNQKGYMQSSYELEIGENPKIFSMLRVLAKISQRPDVDSEFHSKTLFYNVLQETFSSARSMEKSEVHAIIEDCKEYLEINYMESHNLKELARRYNMCPKYLSDVFKKYTGVSPIDYLISYRVKQAHNLLLSTSCSIKEISNSVGYDDAHYFSRLFKKRFGFAPSEIRNIGSAKSS